MKTRPLRSLSTTMVALSFALAVAVPLVTASPRADADDAQMVSLRDGTSVTGKVVEYVEGDHVTLELASGEKRRIEWGDLATPPSAPRIDTLPLAPPIDTARKPFVPPPSAYNPGDPPRVLPDELREERSPSGTPSSSRAGFGVQGGVNSPFGTLALTIDYFPFSWLGVEGVVAMPVLDEPVTLGEGLLFEWRIAGGLAMGGGVGFAQALVKTIIPGDRPGLANYITIDCSHIAYAVTPNLVLRGTLDIAFGLSDRDYCKAHPEACPQLEEFPLSGLLSVMWMFDLSGGAQ